MINGSLALQSRYISYQELTACNLTSKTGSEGIRIISVEPVQTGNITFRVINATEN
jgi:hypothetical protein